MTDPGLTNRLRQHSRRAGLAVGLSMAVTIAVCLGGFVWIFAEVDPFLRDFIAAEREPTEEPPPRTQEAAQSEEEPENGDANDAPPAEPEEEESEPAPTATSPPAPTPTPETFQADYVVIAGESVNLRAGPGTSFEVVITLFNDQELQYLGESEETTNPSADLLSPGQQWLRFRTETGEEGWVREIDVEQTG